MANGNMHQGEADIDQSLVLQLIRTQFPHLSDLEVTAFPSTGTVNAIYRLGRDLCVRLPRMKEWAGDLAKEIDWLPKLAPHVSLEIPQPVAMGKPGSGYPFEWAIYRWIDGETFAADRVSNEGQAATDLALFVAGLRQADPSGAPRSGRKPLIQLDEITRSAIRSLHGLLDTEGALAVWQNSICAPEWNGDPIWIHCDLLPPNLLVDGERLKAVIDFGASGIGDSAQDVTPAWSVFGTSGRHVFRNVLDVDEGTWTRARGYALHQALLIIPYYSKTNPDFAAMATRTVNEILADYP